MHDASDSSQVEQCSREPPRGNQNLSRGQDAHHHSMGTCGARWPPWRAAERFRGMATASATSSAGDGQRAPRMSHITLTVPGMNNPPGRYDVTVRVAKDDGHSPDPAAFAAAASQAASRVNASVLSAHTAEEIICVVCVAAPDRPAAVAVALAVVAGALNAEDPVRSPSR
jgi:hypothetical protein